MKFLEKLFMKSPKFFKKQKANLFAVNKSMYLDNRFKIRSKF